MNSSVRNRKGKKPIFTIENFNKELIQLINNVYEKDFEMFNYEKREII